MNKSKKPFSLKTQQQKEKERKFLDKMLIISLILTIFVIIAWIALGFLEDKFQSLNKYIPFSLVICLLIIAFLAGIYFFIFAIKIYAIMWRIGAMWGLILYYPSLIFYFTKYRPFLLNKKSLKEIIRETY